MIEYLLLFIIGLILTYIYNKISDKNKNAKIIIGFFIFFMFFIIQAIRYDVGTDFLGTYTKEYYNALAGIVNTKLDIGFIFLYKFIIHFNMDKQWIFIISSFIINIFVFSSIFKHSKNKFISLAVFFLGSFFFFSMNGIRQSIAAAIFYYSIIYIKDRDFKRFLLLNIIGSLFHSSALLFIPLYFVLTHKFTRLQRIIVMIIIILSIGILTPKILEAISMTKYAGYLINPEYNVAGRISLSSLVNIAIYVLFELFDRKKINDTEYNIYLNLHYLGVVITILSTATIIIFRLFLSFRFVEFLSIPYLIYYVKENKVAIKARILLYIFIAFLFMGYFTYSIAIQNYNDTIPYKTIFDNN